MRKLKKECSVKKIDFDYVRRKIEESKVIKLYKNMTAKELLAVTIILFVLSILLFQVMAIYGINYLLVFLALLLIFLTFCSVTSAMYKLQNEEYMKFRDASLTILQNDLDGTLKRVRLFTRNNTNENMKILNNLFDNNVYFYAKIDQNNIVTLIAKDINDKVIYTKDVDDYIWFVRTFYIV